MIYLIDDNSKGQRLGYGASFIDDGVYDDVLIHIEKINGSVDMSFLKKAKLIMMHDSLEDYENDSFVENSHAARQNIDDILHACNIPTVCFSDGHLSPIFDSEGNISQLRKADFYYRLRDFLDIYKDSGILEFNILAFGKNWKAVKLRDEIKGLYSRLEHKHKDEIIEIKDVLPIKSSDGEEPNYLYNIIETYSQPVLGKNYNDIIDYLEDEPMTVGEFKQRIDKIFISVNKYGKNTYTWK